jgi:antitoxin ParD1/3/4
MSQLKISLPDATNRFIEEQVATGRYGSPSDFVVELVEKARQEAAREKLAELILEGENSGIGVEVTDEWLEKRMAALRAEAERRRSA